MAFELKPCPFCGCDGEMSRDFCTAGGKLEWESFRVFHNCKAVGPMATDRFGTEAEAAEAWNRRAERTCRAIDHGAAIEGAVPLLECSVCGEFNYAQANGDPWRFCPHCGAKVLPGEEGGAR